MLAWSPERYRALAAKCRTEAISKLPTKARAVLALAEEYEAKARALEAARGAND
jgi:hypothetical protein